MYMYTNVHPCTVEVKKHVTTCVRSKRYSGTVKQQQYNGVWQFRNDTV